MNDEKTVLTDANAIIARHFANDPANAVRAQQCVTEVLAKLCQPAASDAGAVPVVPEDDAIAEAWMTLSEVDGIEYHGPSFGRGYRAALLAAPPSAPAAEPVPERAAMVEAARNAGFQFWKMADGKYQLKPIVVATAQAAPAAESAERAAKADAQGHTRANCPPPVDDTERAEREHMGCAQCRTGIYGQGDERALLLEAIECMEARGMDDCDWVRSARAALSRQPSAAVGVGDEFYWIFVSEPGMVVCRKGGWTNSKFVEQMLRELYAAKPNATCIVVEGPYHLDGTDGREWVSMYGDRRRKPIPRAALAAAKPEGGIHE